MANFEWDEAKAEENLRKHGIGFRDASSSLLGLSCTVASPRGGENRFTSLCETNGRLIAVVWTPRFGAIRLISARAARKHEQEHYRQSIRRTAPTWGQ
ncbi:BrnT family toxin [Phenylobacterium sp.]|uniref:BrnT family toxin n=1 Tax=Phenylobacterium sp. TaxID=1871053 RepID=UPI00386215CE